MKLSTTLLSLGMSLCMAAPAMAAEQDTAPVPTLYTEPSTEAPVPTLYDAKPATTVAVEWPEWIGFPFWFEEVSPVSYDMMMDYARTVRAQELRSQKSIPNYSFFGTTRASQSLYDPYTWKRINPDIIMQETLMPTTVKAPTSKEWPTWIDHPFWFEQNFMMMWMEE